MFYEVIIETVEPLGPEPFKKTFDEVETGDPMAYVKAHCKFPVIEDDTNKYGERVITCGDGKFTAKYTFSE